MHILGRSPNCQNPHFIQSERTPSDIQQPLEAARGFVLSLSNNRNMPDYSELNRWSWNVKSHIPAAGQASRGQTSRWPSSTHPDEFGRGGRRRGWTQQDRPFNPPQDGAWRRRDEQEIHQEEEEEQDWWPDCPSGTRTHWFWSACCLKAQRRFQAPLNQADV